jgi:KDO2-lipid IV(A) lauroyltransferase
MEGQVRKNPGQYWWIHRRFKTRPEGEPPFYE